MDQQVSGMDEFRLAGGAFSASYAAEMQTGLFAGTILARPSAAIAGSVNALATLWDTDVGTERGSLRNIATAIQSSPETKAQAEAIVKKLESGQKLSYVERKLAA